MKYKNYSQKCQKSKSFFIVYFVNDKNLIFRPNDILLIEYAILKNYKLIWFKRLD